MLVREQARPARGAHNHPAPAHATPGNNSHVHNNRKGMKPLLHSVDWKEASLGIVLLIACAIVWPRLWRAPEPS